MGEVKLQQSDTSSEFEVKDLGRPHSLRYNVLISIINEEYDRALTILHDFLDGESPYPNFKIKIERYCLHSIDLVYAIQAKRNFPGAAQLTRSKQQELKDKFKEHFSELRVVLKKMENAMEELRLNDVRSTKIIIMSVWSAVVTVFCAAVVIDFCRGLGATINNVVSDEIEHFLLYIIQKIF